MIVLGGSWWSFVVRGIVAILFGLMTIFLPHMALLTLVYLFGFYAIFDGVLNFAAAFSRRSHRGVASDETSRELDRAAVPWWALLIQGIFGIIAGLIAFFIPGLTALALLYLIAAWALVSGISSIVAAVRLRKQIRGEWLLVLSGVLSIIFGILAAIFPGAGALAVLIWIGAYAIVLGALLIALGVKLRGVLHAPLEPGHLRHGRISPA